MNKEYIETKDCIVVNTDKGLKKRKKNKNILEILKSENNIEEINILLKSIPNFVYVLDHISSSYTSKALSFSLPISLIVAIILSITNILSVSIAFLGVCLIGGLTTIISGAIAIKNSGKIHKKIEEKQKELLNSELESENEKIIKLSNEATLDNEYGLGKIKKIERTQLIKNLKRNLEIITEYQLNRQKYIKLKKEKYLFKELRSKGYSTREILFISELATNDLILEYTIKKEKTLKLEKKY